MQKKDEPTYCVQCEDPGNFLSWDKSFIKFVLFQHLFYKVLNNSLKPICQVLQPKHQK